MAPAQGCAGNRGAGWGTQPRLFHGVLASLLPRADDKLTARLRLSTQRSHGGGPGLLWVPRRGLWGEHWGNQCPGERRWAQMNPAWG